jgi:hypothetical protein
METSSITPGPSPEDFPQYTASNGRQEPDPLDPFSQLWRPLPPNAKVTRGKGGYELRLQLSPSEALVAVYSALSAIEHLKETSLLSHSDPVENQFSKALPDLMTKARQIRALEDTASEIQAQEFQKHPLEAQIK